MACYFACGETETTPETGTWKRTEGATCSGHTERKVPLRPTLPFVHSPFPLLFFLYKTIAQLVLQLRSSSFSCPIIHRLLIKRSWTTALLFLLPLSVVERTQAVPRSHLIRADLLLRYHLGSSHHLVTLHRHLTNQLTLVRHVDLLHLGRFPRSIVSLRPLSTRLAVSIT